MSDLSHMARVVKGIKFPYPLMVGGGIVKTWEQVRKLAPTDVIPEWGSIETEPSGGNGGRDYYEHIADGRLMYTINSLGLPNPGMGYVEQHAKDMIQLYADSEKPLAINVSGKSREDLLELIKRAVALSFPVITANAACPNRVGHPILCNDIAAVHWVMEKVEEEVGETSSLILWKVAGGMKVEDLQANMQFVRASKVFGGAVCGNTVANGATYLSDGSSAIHTDKGPMVRGGMAGPAIKPIALGQVQIAHSILEDSKIIVGTGGITSARDMLDYMKAGATLTQVVSYFRYNNEDPRCITEILQKYAEMTA